MAQIPIASIPEEVDQRLPQHRPDGSRIGVNYADAFGKCLNTTLPDGRPLAYKRRGLELTLTLGDQKAKTLLDRWAGQGDAQSIHNLAMTRLAEQLGYKYRYEDRQVIFEN
jgi:hypothetical protein